MLSKKRVMLGSLDAYVVLSKPVTSFDASLAAFEVRGHRKDERTGLRRMARGGKVQTRARKTLETGQLMMTQRMASNEGGCALDCRSLKAACHFGAVLRSSADM